MAKSSVNVAAQCRDIISKAEAGSFSPVYLLMGDEPYYLDMVCDAIVEHSLDEFARDFNETICYGADVDADTVVTAARRFPMMAERQLVILKEAQQMKSLEELAIYCEKPLDSTVLVILMHRASADKRRSLYKTVLKTGEVLESNLLRDYELPRWIQGFYEEKGLRIHPEACSLLAESAGEDLGKIAVETEKLLKNLPEGVKEISVEDVEKNVGVSRQYSIFELTKCLSFRDSAKALRIAARIGAAPRFAMPAATGPIGNHFSRILKYHALIQKGRQADAAKVLGVNPYFMKEYDAAVRNYPLDRCITAVSLIAEYDYKSKGGANAGEATQAELLQELVVKLLNI